MRGPEISAVEALVREIERALQAKLYYLAIIVCLTLPDVCAALESENGRTSQEKYKDWYSNHAKTQAGGIDPDECYSLRCGMAHQGKIDIAKGGADRVIFTFEQNYVRIDGVTIKTDTSSAYVFDADQWCRRWIYAVQEWYKIAKNNPIVQRNIQNMMQVRPFGLAPFKIGEPLIA